MKRLVLAFTDKSRFARDWKLCEQIVDAAASAPRNISEGFGRFGGKEFANFLRVAIGSLQETRNHLLDACERGYITVSERDQGIALSRRAAAAATRLRAYLLSPDNKMSGKRSASREPSRGTKRRPVART